MVVVGRCRLGIPSGRLREERTGWLVMVLLGCRADRFSFLPFFLTRYKGCVCVVRVKGEGCRARVLFSKASSSSAEEASSEHGKWIKVWEKVRSVRISVFFSFLSTRLLDSPFIQPIRLRILLSSCQIVLKFQEVLSLLLLQQRQQMTNRFKSVDS